jgi:hypothetical protein
MSRAETRHVEEHYCAILSFFGLVADLTSARAGAMARARRFDVKTHVSALVRAHVRTEYKDALEEEDSRFAGVAFGRDDVEALVDATLAALIEYPWMTARGSFALDAHIEASLVRRAREKRTASPSADATWRASSADIERAERVRVVDERVDQQALAMDELRDQLAALQRDFEAFKLEFAQRRRDDAASAPAVGSKRTFDESASSSSSSSSASMPPLPWAHLTSFDSHFHADSDLDE